MSWIVKLGKKGKKIVKKIITPAEKHYVGYTRRIERVKTGERICAMTFDDGPMGLPASPERFEGKTLTDVLLESLRPIAQEHLQWTQEFHRFLHCRRVGGVTTGCRCPRVGIQTQQFHQLAQGMRHHVPELGLYACRRSPLADEQG